MCVFKRSEHCAAQPSVCRACDLTRVPQTITVTSLALVGWPLSREPGSLLRFAPADWEDPLGPVGTACRVDTFRVGQWPCSGQLPCLLAGLRGHDPCPRPINPAGFPQALQ